jgi:hypothetical protein
LSQNPGTLLRVARTLHREVRDPSRGSGPYPWRSPTLPGGPVRICWGLALSLGSGPTVDTLEDIVFPGHVTALEPPTWRGHVLFVTRLRLAAWTPHLHTIVTGTPFLGYRQWPPGLLQGRIRACRWGQSWICQLVRCFCALAGKITASPPSNMSTTTPISVAD